MAVIQRDSSGQPFLFVKVDGDQRWIRADWEDTDVPIRPWDGNSLAEENANVFPGLRITTQLWDDGDHGLFAYNVVPA